MRIAVFGAGGVGAVTHSPAGVFRQIPETRQMLERALEEIVQVGKGCQVDLLDDIVDKTLVFIDQMPVNVTASMQRDIMDGKPSELEAQNGAVVRLAKTAGIRAPTHEFIYASLLPHEKIAR